MNIHFHTLGCKVNQYETEVMRESLLNRGHTNFETLPADAVIINSCTVTAESDRKTRQLIRKMRKQNPLAVILLTGCMAQAFPEDTRLIDELDIVVGNRDVLKVIETLQKKNLNKTTLFNVEKHERGDLYNTPGISDFSERTRAFMKIEDGCDRYCSYCIIPTARGHVRSRKTEDIKAEAVRLAQKGFLEVVLVGINLSAYGLGENYNLCDAVEQVCSVEGIKRVRLGSLEPDHITDEMLSRFKSQPKFCPQFHLSLQSGCDETLKRMNRHYDSAFYENLVNRIRNMFPDASITTDIMVGFVGETDEEFSKSIAFAKKIGFARAHIFPYSVRKGTVAANLKPQITNNVKSERAHIMSKVTSCSELDFLNKQCGRVFPVLFESTQNGFSVGYTPNYSRVLVKSTDSLEGKILNIYIEKAESDYCIGKLL